MKLTPGRRWPATTWQPRSAWLRAPSGWRPEGFSSTPPRVRCMEIRGEEAATKMAWPTRKRVCRRRLTPASCRESACPRVWQALELLDCNIAGSVPSRWRDRCGWWQRRPTGRRRGRWWRGWRRRWAGRVFSFAPHTLRSNPVWKSRQDCTCFFICDSGSRTVNKLNWEEI